MENEDIIKNNQKILSSIKDIIISAGIPSTYVEPVSSRSYKTRTKFHNWVASLEELIPTQDNNHRIEEERRSWERMISEWESEIKQNENKRIQEEKTRLMEAERSRTLGILTQKYGLPLLSSVDDIIETIINKNKYLRLAFYLNNNRNDWSDGPTYAEIGLSGFDISSDEDQKIYDEIESLCDNWDDDGRIFRDCDYNYGWLIENKVPDELKSDYNMVMKYYS